MKSYYLAIVLLPLLAAVVAGLAGKKIGRAGAHWVTIIGVGMSFVLSSFVLYKLFWGGATPENISVYTWASWSTG
jgi:NADH-quinone oxidoreductase subunit L